MNWTDLLTAKIEETYGATLGLAKKAKDSELGFRPATGGNWMTPSIGRTRSALAARSMADVAADAAGGIAATPAVSDDS